MRLKDLKNISNGLNSTDRMPVLFLGHGSPMNAVEENEFVKGFRNIGELLPRPNAILCVSAHWETNGTFLTAMEKPKTIHDFYGFPEELYNIRYPAPGNPELARNTKEIITKTNVGLDDKWGLDHGCWSVVKHLYPDADIPVIQMSLDYTQSPQYHYELAKELSLLRTKGILIAGSGNIVHNLKMIAWDKLNDDFGYDWALHVNEKVKQYILAGNHRELIKYKSGGREFELAVPTPEHYLPLLYALALQEKEEHLEFFNDKPVGGSLTMTSVLIGNENSSKYDKI